MYSLCSEMAEASISVSKDEFSCSVCLQLLNDPVTIPCGHNYCMICISKYWNQDDQKGVHSCPQCRKSFSPRPDLNKNTVIAGMVEKLKKTRKAIPAHSHPGPGDTGKKHKAINLACQNSDGQNNFEQHEEFNSGKRHKVTDDGTGQLQQMICPQHGQILDINSTDQHGVCHLCKLKETQKKYQQKIQMRQKQIQELRACVESHKRSAQTAVEDCEIMFTELISSIEKSRSEVSQLIRDQENAAVSQTEGLLDQLEKEIDDLRRRDDELEELSNTNYDINFLQKFQSISAPPESPDSSSITVMSLSFDDVGKSVSHLRDNLERFCREELEKISDRVKYTEITLCPEPKTRNEFLPYYHRLTLDPNTVNERLQLSEENRVVAYISNVCQYPDHPDRFHPLLQVLCREIVCERCYWEVEWSNKVSISVSYKSIGRKGRVHESEFGLNDQSWSLFCSDSSYSFTHNKIKTELPVVSRCCKVGVYVDHSRGTLSFYNVSDSMTLIHSVQTTFTQPLYPGFKIHLKSKVKICY
ncbi:tripartite motif-containing protein 16-like protein [Misgurnus anguillicaudatus]|uniref:tripartite motif-containing protein 16-like protein n=1 Tax=Misgurnus anguillicaudatus TaxID=75329 RepID=UPI003CCF2D89